MVNNFHYLRGGAERSYFDTAEILKDKGHKVAFFSTKHKDNFPGKWDDYFVSYFDLEAKHGFGDKLRIIGRILYNKEAKRKIRKLIKDFRPDVAHLHNVYHHLSPSVISELKRQGVPMVMTLHDYKPVCPNYNLFVRGEVWEKSKKNKYYRCFWDKCIKDSYAKSAVCTLEAYVHKIMGVYRRVDIFISPSRFLINKFREFGFKEDIRHLPNPLPDTAEKEAEKPSKKGRYALYFGRLSQEKGVDDLIKAFKDLDDKSIELKIVGKGPQQQELKELIDGYGLNDKIELPGPKYGQELKETIAGAEFIVFPFKWYENYPYVVLEAQKAGKLVICSDIGGTREMIKDGYNGFLYEAGNIKQLTQAMKLVTEGHESFKHMGERARYGVEKNNGREKFYKDLFAIYSNIIKK